MDYIEEEEYYFMSKKRKRINMCLNCFTNEQLDEIIEILKNISVLTHDIESNTAEMRTEVYNNILQAVDEIESLEKQEN